jgi:hypothetical protein
MSKATSQQTDMIRLDSIKDWPELTSLPEYSRRLLDKIAIV